MCGKLRNMQKGDGIFILTPSNSMSVMSEKMIRIGINRLEKFGYRVKFGRYINEQGELGVSSLEQRIDDFHSALSSPDTTMIMAAFGGYNSNQLLDVLDYDLIKESGKLIIGYSDTTGLLNGIHHMTGCKTLHGMSFSAFCDPNLFPISMESFLRLINGEHDIELSASDYCADDLWYLKESLGPREVYPHPGWEILQSGECTGKLLGGNLDTLLALAGTPYFPSMENSVLLIESGFNEPPNKFLRSITQLKQLGIFECIQGLMIGMFPRNSYFSDTSKLQELLKDSLKGYDFPIIANVNFSHVDPIYTLPIGGKILVNALETASVRLIGSLYD